MPNSVWLALTLLALAPSSSLGRPSEPPSSSSSSSSSSHPLVKTLGQEIGSPSELAWQAWLLVESKGGISSALDSSNILRRITPKSIFIAPELISCPSGYTTDGRGACKPDPIVIDADLQKQFLLKRLNALYGKFGSKKKPEQQAQGGPLQFNIPISSPTTTNKPEKPIPVMAEQPVLLNDTKSQPSVAVVVYKLDNETSKEDSSSSSSSTSFLLGSTNAPASKKVAEIIVEAMNDTLNGAVVDYKIPASNSTNLNGQSDKKDSSEDSSPTVVLLLTPTKMPSTTLKSKIEETSTEESITETTTTLGTTIIDETIQTVAPLDIETEEIDTTIRTTDRSSSTKSTDDLYEHHDQQMTTTTAAPSTINDEMAYTDEDETEETQTTEQESEEEEEEEEEYEEEYNEDELLKPGEAGMLMSLKNQKLIRVKSRTTVPLMSTTVMTQDTTTVPPTDMMDVYEAKESTIQAEVTSFTIQQTSTELPSTIVVDETTTTTTTTTTPRPQRVTATIQIDSRPIVSERWQPIVATTTRRSTLNPTEAASFFPQRQAQKSPSFTVNDEPIFFKNSGRREHHLPAEFKDQLPNRDRTYVRFPESQSKTAQQQRGFVRFPSDDVNSIHNQDSLKDLSPFQYSSSTKSSVQRWRQQKQKPMLLRFWARMPLVRDLSFYPTTSHGSHNEPIGGPTPPTARRGSTKFRNDA